MNKVILLGRLTRDPEVRYGTGENVTAVARYPAGDAADLQHCGIPGGYGGNISAAE